MYAIWCIGVAVRWGIFETSIHFLFQFRTTAICTVLNIKCLSTMLHISRTVRGLAAGNSGPSGATGERLETGITPVVSSYLKGQCWIVLPAKQVKCNKQNGNILCVWQFFFNIKYISIQYLSLVNLIPNLLAGAWIHSSFPMESVTSCWRLAEIWKAAMGQSRSVWNPSCLSVALLMASVAGRQWPPNHGCPLGRRVTGLETVAGAALQWAERSMFFSGPLNCSLPWLDLGRLRTIFVSLVALRLEQPKFFAIHTHQWSEEMFPS